MPIIPFYLLVLKIVLLCGPCHKITYIQGFPLGHALTSLLSYRDKLESLNFVWLVWVFVVSMQQVRFSCDVTHVMALAPV